MNPSIEPPRGPPFHSTLPVPPAPSPAISRQMTSWFTSYRLPWLDDLELPRWAPDGDPSAAVRIREL